jgi:glycosyltransferase involved in cell wall biosynthesis
MKVTILTSFPFPYGKATANRIGVFADEMHKQPSIDIVEIICCSDKPTTTFIYREGVDVSNINVKSINKNRLFSRAVHEFYIAIKLWRRARFSNSDLILVTIPSALLLIPMVLNKGKKPIALDVRDAVWTYLGNGIVSRIASFFIEKLFIHVAKRSEFISVTNSSEFQSVREISGKAPLLVPNGISKNNFDNMKLLNIRSLSQNVKLVYVGNVGIAQEIDVLLDFARTIDNLSIIIVGDGARLESLKQKCIRDNINNVEFTGFLCPKDALAYMDGADVLFAQIGQKYATAIPTKIFEYIACGRRLLLGLPSGPAKDVFSQFAGVEIFTPGNINGLSESYEMLLNKNFDQVMREHNLDILKTKYIREEGAKTLVDSIALLSI